MQKHKRIVSTYCLMQKNSRKERESAHLMAFFDLKQLIRHLTTTKTHKRFQTLIRIKLTASKRSHTPSKIFSRGFTMTTFNASIILTISL